MERIAILGPGGVGGFLAVALERAGTPVTVVAREETAEVIGRDGIRLDSVLLGELTARPRAVSRLEAPVDALIVATKASGLDPALERVAADARLVVPLLNGLDHVARLRERFGPRAIAASIRIEADRPAPAVITQTSPLVKVEMASDDPAPQQDIEALAGILNTAGVPAFVQDSEAQTLWSKLTRLSSLACMTSAYDLPIGRIRTTPELRDELMGCIREACAAANADGARMDPDRVMAELDATHETLGSSMQRDIAAGREPELDAIPGAVMRAAARLGLECPTIASLVARIAQRAGVPAPTVA